MVLNLLTGFVYEIVQQSWLVSTVLIKYILFFTSIEVYIREGLNFEHFKEVVLENSRVIVTTMVIFGLINAFLKIEFSPIFKIGSQLITLSYFGFLFWKY